MDILLKLRVLIWVAIISLWGIMVYQYLGEEEAPSRPGMAHVPNPYRSLPPSPTIMPESAQPTPGAAQVLPEAMVSMPVLSPAPILPRTEIPTALAPLKPRPTPEAADQEGVSCR